MEDKRKYMDYELAYNMYKEVVYLLQNGGIQKVEDKFEECGDRTNGYTSFYGSEYNTWVYLVNKNFGTAKNEDWYANGEVDIVSYSDCYDTIYINSIDAIRERLQKLKEWSNEHNYSNEDYENEKYSLEKIMSDLLNIRYYGEIMLYLALQIENTFVLKDKWLLIDEYYNKIAILSEDYKLYDNSNKSLLDSINDYIDNNKDKIYDMIKSCVEEII